MMVRIIYVGAKLVAEVQGWIPSLAAADAVATDQTALMLWCFDGGHDDDDHAGRRDDSDDNVGSIYINPWTNETTGDDSSTS